MAAAAAALAVLASPLVPGPPGEAGRRLASAEADGPDPLAPPGIDVGALRAIGSRLPDDATYALDAAGEDPVVQGGLKAAAQLFLAPSLPVQDPARAEWIVRLHEGALSLERAAP